MVFVELYKVIFFKPLIPKFIKLDEKILINEDFDFIIRLFKNNLIHTVLINLI